MHPTGPEDLSTGKPLFEKLSFYIFFRTLSEEILILKPKMPAGLAKLHSVRPELFSRDSRFFVRKLTCKPFSDCRRKTFGRMKKKYLTGVSNLKSTCPDDRSDEKKTFFAGITVHFSSSEKKFSERLIKSSRRDRQTAFHVPKGYFFLRKLFEKRLRFYKAFRTSS